MLWFLFMFLLMIMTIAICAAHTVDVGRKLWDEVKAAKAQPLIRAPDDTLDLKACPYRVYMIEQGKINVIKSYPTAQEARWVAEGFRDGWNTLDDLLIYYDRENPQTKLEHPWDMLTDKFKNKPININKVRSY